MTANAISIDKQKLYKKDYEFLNSINYFRGLAIILIVIGHCWTWSGISINTIPRKIITNLIMGGTSLFVFISGYLFHHVFYPKFNYLNFFKKKFKNVFIPYFTLSILPVIYHVLYVKNGVYNQYFCTGKNGILNEYILPIIEYIVTGRIFVAYWYIPFIMIVFALSPIVIFYIELRSTTRIIIVLFLSLVSMVLHRPIDNINTFQHVLYFMPVYLIGVLAAMHKNFIYEKLKGKELFLIIVIMCFSITQVLFYNNWENFHKYFFEITTIDIMFPQKIVMCLFFVIILNRFENIHIPFLNLFARKSFSIYFIHTICWAAMENTIMTKSFVKNISGLILFPSLFIALIAISLGISMTIKKVFKEHSRVIIGS